MLLITHYLQADSLRCFSLTLYDYIFLYLCSNPIYGFELVLSVFIADSVVHLRSEQYPVLSEVTGSKASPVSQSETMAHPRRSPGVSPGVYVGRGGVLFTEAESANFLPRTYRFMRSRSVENCQQS